MRNNLAFPLIVSAAMLIAGCGEEPERRDLRTRSVEVAARYLNTHDLGSAQAALEDYSDALGGSQSGTGSLGGSGSGSLGGAGSLGGLGGLNFDAEAINELVSGDEEGGSAISDGPSVGSGGIARGSSLAPSGSIVRRAGVGVGGIARAAGVGIGGAARGPAALLRGAGGGASIADFTDAFCHYLSASCNFAVSCVDALNDSLESQGFGDQAGLSGGFSVNLDGVCAPFEADCAGLMADPIAEAQLTGVPPEVVDALNCIADAFEGETCSLDAEAMSALGAKLSNLGEGCGLASFAASPGAAGAPAGL